MYSRTIFLKTILFITIFFSCAEKKSENQDYTGNEKNEIIQKTYAHIKEIEIEIIIADSLEGNENYSTAEKAISNANRRGYADYGEDILKKMKDDLLMDNPNYSHLNKLNKKWVDTKNYYESNMK